MKLPLSPRATAVLRELIYTASETLHDGTYYLDGRTRQSDAVRGAEKEFHELSIAVNNGLLDDAEKFESTLERLDKTLGNLARLDISVTGLMVRRDYADQKLQKKADHFPKNYVPARSRPRLIVENSNS